MVKCESYSLEQQTHSTKTNVSQAKGAPNYHKLTSAFFQNKRKQPCPKQRVKTGGSRNPKSQCQQTKQNWSDGRKRKM
jgi:hypothetical protein